MVKNFIVALCALTFYCHPSEAATYTVSNANDAGAGSFRQALLDANASPGLDQIRFTGSFSITLVSVLPIISDPVLINGPYTTGPQIELNGGTNSIVGAGLQLAASASGSVIRGLNIHGMQWQGILISASNISISGCYIGTDLSGMSDLGNKFSGIEIAANQKNIRIGGITADSGNVISGNDQIGINVSPGCDSIKIFRNKIGANASGNAAIPNGISTSQQPGILVTSASHVVIGGQRSIQGNIISGNTGMGIIANTSTTITIAGNLIGTNATGIAAIANNISGIQLNQSAARIGGTTPDSANVISGNSAIGIDVLNSTGTVIKGNLIGVGLDGTTACGNGQHGIQLANCGTTLVGGPSYLHKNVISSNSSHGILIDASTNITIQGNFIGTDKAGLQKRGNGSHGIQLQTSASNIVIGGRRYIEGNILSNNAGSGINFEDGGTGKLNAPGTIINGNLVGTDSTATQDFGNNVIGIIVKSDNCIIGDTTDQQGNVIGGTDIFCGLLIANGSGNKIEGNFIGVGINGTTAIANKQDGILIGVENSAYSANNNIVRYNTIAYNGRYGVNVGKTLNNNISNNERGNVIRFNKIYCNTDLGIFLNLSAATDWGNNGQKSPAINYFLSTTTVIQGVTDLTMANKKIDLYLVTDCPNCDINPQGKVWVDSVTVSATGSWSYNYFAKFGTTIPAEVVATVTDNSGNTSQFSLCCHATSGTSIVPSVNPVCPGVVFNLKYSAGQSGDSLMLQQTLDTIGGTWANVRAVALTDPVIISNLSITDTTFYRFITFSQGTFVTAACKDSSFIIRVDLAPTAIAGTAGIAPDTICNGQSTILTLTGYTGSIQWQQSNAGGSFSNIAGATTASYPSAPSSSQSPVMYRARVSRSVCPDAYSNTVNVIVPNVSSGTIAGPGKICNSEATELSLNGSSGSVQWQDSSAGDVWKNIPGEITLSYLYQPKTVTAIEYIRVIVSGPNGRCAVASGIFTAFADTCLNAQPIELPNALTPNADGNNDVFYIKNIWLYPDNHLIIYNRWGNIVFESKGYVNEWDGTHKGEKLPEATYYFVLELGKDTNGNFPGKNNYHGDVTIIR